MDNVRIGLAGCGSVSEKYLSHLQNCPYGQVVAVCDIIEDRYRQRMHEYDIKHGYADVEAMLREIDFDLLLNTTSMPSHGAVNRLGLEAGRHVFCEKPFAGSVDEGKALIALSRTRGLRLWGAPDAVLSPQFACMAEILHAKEIGSVYAAHGCYGHGGPTWGPWFYQPGGGCVFDLAVYNITTLTGLLGPAKQVVAMEGTAIPERLVDGETVSVRAEDNAMLLLDHGNAVFSHIQTGFVYHLHRDEWTIELIGNGGAMSMEGWDWAPRGIKIKTSHDAPWVVRCPDPADYVWEGGAAHACRCLVENTQSAMDIEHALHVVEIMCAAHESARTGQRISLETSFRWPLSL